MEAWFLCSEYQGAGGFKEGSTLYFSWKLKQHSKTDACEEFTSNWKIEFKSKIKSPLEDLLAGNNEGR